MYNIILSSFYKKRSTIFIQRHPDLIKKYKKTILLLQDNPYHPSLRLHKLKGDLSEFYSISINLKYRILLDFIIIDETIILIDIGNHDEVYQ